MSAQGFLFNPLQAQAVMLKAMVDVSRETQSLTVDAIKRAGKRKSSPVEWVPFEVPVLDPRSFVDEDVMRATFHRMADRNLRGWEVAADLLKAMPSWMSMSTKMPGTVMTDWFDQMRRAGEAAMPANDAWATGSDTPAPQPRTRARAEAAVKPATRTAAKPAAKPARKKAVAAIPAALATPAKTVKKTSAATLKPAAARPSKAKRVAKASEDVKPATRTTVARKAATRAAPPKTATPKVAKSKTDGPVRLKAPQGRADDLTAIKGIGIKLASLLNTVGIYHYDQIASWTAADGRWIDEKLAFKGRVAREKWVSQAKALVKKAA